MVHNICDMSFWTCEIYMIFKLWLLVVIFTFFKWTLIKVFYSVIVLHSCDMKYVYIMQVVEIGKGSKVKYELDKKTGLIKVITVVQPFSFPCLFSLHVAEHASMYRLTVYSTLLLCTPTTMALSHVLYVRTVILWMS